MTSRAAARAVLVAALVLASTAHADVLLEAHPTVRADDAERVLAVVREALAAGGVAVEPRDVLASHVVPISDVALLAPADAPALPDDAARIVDNGVAQTFRGDYDAGLAALQQILAAAAAHPDKVLGDDGSPTWRRKALAAVAFAWLRKREPTAARRALVEAMRGSEGDPIGRIVGPDVAALAASVRKELDAGPHGALLLVVPAELRIAIDEYPEPRRGANVPISLPPGEYRIAISDARITRYYHVSIVADRATTLAPDPIDGVLHADETWIGFAAQPGTDDALAHYAQRAVRDDVFAVGIVERGDRRYVVGKFFEKRTGNLLREAAIARWADDGRCSKALAGYLLRGDRSPCLVALPPDVGAEPRDRYVAAGAFGGAAALVGFLGLAAIRTTEDAPSSRERHYDSAPGIALLAAGGVSLGVATILAIRGAGHREASIGKSRAPAYAAFGAALGAFAAGGYLVAVDGRGTCGLEGEGACRYNYNTATGGAVLLGVGAASTIFGIYWTVRRSDRVHAQPTVVVAPGGGFAGLSGSF